MRRSRAFDWLLLVTLLPIYLVIQGMSIRECLARPARAPLASLASLLRVGDQLVRVPRR